MKEKEEKADRRRDNIKERTGMDFATLAWAAEDRTRWNWIIVKSSMVLQLGID